VQGHLDRQIKKVLETAETEPIPDNVLTLAGGDQKRARVIWKKLRLKQEFPMTLTEAKTPYLDAKGKSIGLTATDLPPIDSYAKAAAKINSTSGVSAALLMLALGRNRGAGTLTGDDLGSAAFDTNGDGYKEIIDGFNNPLQFYRWPTGSAAVDGLRPASAKLIRDPLDPDGTLLDPSWYNTPQRKSFESICHTIKSNTHPNGFYLVAVLASMGPDEKLGLNLTTMSTTNATDETDNIYSFKLP